MFILLWFIKLMWFVSMFSIIALLSVLATVLLSDIRGSWYWKKRDR
jgi:hypothetical protein